MARIEQRITALERQLGPEDQTVIIVFGSRIPTLISATLYRTQFSNA